MGEHHLFYTFFIMLKGMKGGRGDRMGWDGMVIDM
jgi:hypothetical protein